MRIDGAYTITEEIVFQETGTKKFEDYYRVGGSEDY